MIRTSVTPRRANFTKGLSDWEVVVRLVVPDELVVTAMTGSVIKNEFIVKSAVMNVKPYLRMSWMCSSSFAIVSRAAFHSST